jgi:hypothetical protein
VCRADEIAPGKARRVEIEGREIAIFNVNGEFAAIGDRCPHEGASLCKGQIMGLAQSDEPGPVPHDPPGRVRALPLARLGVRPEDRAVLVRSHAHARQELRRRGHRQRAAAGRPYRIDIYEVSQEGDYVVVSV